MTRDLSKSVFIKGSALVFAPHPDDEVFGCGGAILKHLREGDEVKVIIVTDGAFPLIDVQKTPDYSQVRKAESIAAAKILGYGKTEFWEYKDGALEATEKLIVQIFNLIDDFRPGYIYLPAETETHPDHLALNKAGIEAAKRFPENIKLFFYEINQPLSANYFVDITKFQPTLERAMDCFKSQLAAYDYKNHVRSLHTIRSYTLGIEVKYAEAYHVLDSNSLKTGEELWVQKPKPESSNQKDLSPDHELPLISIIVRTINRPELPEALESIAKQNYPNIEVIVVDARGEKPLELGPGCGKFPLRVISKNKALNRPEAANAGLEAVQGEYFSFLDEDDLLYPNHFFGLIDCIKSSDALVAYSGIKLKNVFNQHSQVYNEEYNFYKLLIANFIPIHALLFSSSIIKLGCFFDIKFEILEDWDFLLQAATFGDFIHHNYISGIYRNDDNSGAQFDQEKSMHIHAKLFNKWRMKITHDQYYNLIEYMRTMTAALLSKKEYIDQYEKEKEKNFLLQDQLNMLEMKIDAIVNSKSWKITSPIRRLSERIL